MIFLKKEIKLSGGMFFISFGTGMPVSGIRDWGFGIGDF